MAPSSITHPNNKRMTFATGGHGRLVPRHGQQESAMACPARARTKIHEAAATRWLKDQLHNERGPTTASAEGFLKAFPA